MEELPSSTLNMQINKTFEHIETTIQEKTNFLKNHKFHSENHFSIAQYTSIFEIPFFEQFIRMKWSYEL